MHKLPLPQRLILHSYLVLIIIMLVLLGYVLSLAEKEFLLVVGIILIPVWFFLWWWYLEYHYFKNADRYNMPVGKYREVGYWKVPIEELEGWYRHKWLYIFHPNMFINIKEILEAKNE